MRPEATQVLINSRPDAVQLGTFRQWVETEWIKVDSFEQTQDGYVLPLPILAIADDELTGGLSFTFSALPETGKLALWINTLLVAPGSRRLGIGSKLVQEAERLVAAVGTKEIYVYTNVPQLYQKLGWVILRDTGDSKVLRQYLRCQSDT